jgi:putative serine protease PepD
MAERSDARVVPTPAHEGSVSGSRRGRAPTVVLALVVLVAAAVGFAAGLGRDSGPSTQPVASGAPSGAPERAVSTIANALLPSIVQLETAHGLGTGVVYRRGGFILTAAHVVDGAGEVTVRLPDGTGVAGRVVGIHPPTDVAVVRAERRDLEPARLGLNDPPDAGDVAVAIGSPFGLNSTVTAGVVSAVDRPVPTNHGPFPMLQTDAPINPGNSGGALADARARVIGINDLVRTRGGETSGIGFAIPIDVAVRVGRDLVAGRAPATGYLGVGGTSPRLGRPGALVATVAADSPASRAGLRRGDLITVFAGQPVATLLELTAQVRATPPGTAVELEVRRSGRTRKIDVVIGRE